MVGETWLCRVSEAFRWREGGCKKNRERGCGPLRTVNGKVQVSQVGPWKRAQDSKRVFPPLLQARGGIRKRRFRETEQGCRPWGSLGEGV